MNTLISISHKALLDAAIRKLIRNRYQLHTLSPAEISLLKSK